MTSPPDRPGLPIGHPSSSASVAAATWVGRPGSDRPKGTLARFGEIHCARLRRHPPLHPLRPDPHVVGRRRDALDLAVGEAVAERQRSPQLVADADELGVLHHPGGDSQDFGAPVRVRHELLKLELVRAGTVAIKAACGENER